MMDWTDQPTGDKETMTWNEITSTDGVLDSGKPWTSTLRPRGFALAEALEAEPSDELLIKYIDIVKDADVSLTGTQIDNLARELAKREMRGRQVSEYTRRYVLRYRDDDDLNAGRFVVRDDSTGPMSSGGYPYPAPSIVYATVFETATSAKKYDISDQFDVWEIDYVLVRKVESRIVTVEKKVWE
jgi:hypothetical protein